MQVNLDHLNKKRFAGFERCTEDSKYKTLPPKLLQMGGLWPCLSSIAPKDEEVTQLDQS